MNRCIIAFVVVLGIASCATPEKIRFTSGVDQAWAERVYQECEARHGSNVRAYNACVLDFAEND